MCSIMTTTPGTVDLICLSNLFCNCRESLETTASSDLSQFFLKEKAVQFQIRLCA